ncbi:MAG: leucyl aminopeptidase, partial [Anaerolineae bacterium]|nr:leucyl aminopeptidase [Anaerolineae bacterium]
LKSDVADVANIGGRPAGCITAGYFLSKFAPDDMPWVHIDIAGLDQVEKELPYAPKGATGFGVRLLVEMLRRW